MLLSLLLWLPECRLLLCRSTHSIQYNHTNIGYTFVIFSFIHSFDFSLSLCLLFSFFACRCPQIFFLRFCRFSSPPPLSTACFASVYFNFTFMIFFFLCFASPLKRILVCFCSALTTNERKKTFFLLEQHKVTNSKTNERNKRKVFVWMHKKDTLKRSFDQTPQNNICFWKQNGTAKPKQVTYNCVQQTDYQLVFDMYAIFVFCSHFFASGVCVCIWSEHNVCCFIIVLCSYRERWWLALFLLFAIIVGNIEMKNCVNNGK